MQIYQDLKKESIEKVSKKWDRYFQTRTDFFLNLSEILEKEMKVYAVPSIFECSEYRNIIPMEYNNLELALQY